MTRRAKGRAGETIPGSAERGCGGKCLDPRNGTAKTGSSRWSSDDVASLNVDAADADATGNGMRAERDYTGMTKRRPSGRGARDYASPTTSEDPPQPWATQTLGNARLGISAEYRSAFRGEQGALG